MVFFERSLLRLFPALCIVLYLDWSLVKKSIFRNTLVLIVASYIQTKMGNIQFVLPCFKALECLLREVCMVFLLTEWTCVNTLVCPMKELRLSLVLLSNFCSHSEDFFFTRLKDWFIFVYNEKLNKLLKRQAVSYRYKQHIYT